MKEKEVSFAIKLAQLETWNPGLHDAICFYRTDPKGFFIGLLDNKPISCISAVNYGGGYGFMGLFIVKPGYRRKGYGREIWDKAISYLDDCEVVGLDGVPKQVDFYQKEGFKLAYYNSRLQGRSIGGGNIDDSRIVEIGKDIQPAIINYDANYFPVPRRRFLNYWLSRPKTVSLCLVDHNQIAGYAVARKCFFGYKIGPLFANNVDYADSLLVAIRKSIKKGNNLFLDIPGSAQNPINPEALQLAKKHGMTGRAYFTARMYRTKGLIDFNLPVNNWFGVTSFELG